VLEVVVKEREGGCFFERATTTDGHEKKEKDDPCRKTRRDVIPNVT